MRIGIVGGGGWLGGAIAKSILDSGLISPDGLTLSYRRNRLERFPGVHWTANNQELADRSDVIVISVRPGDWPSLAIDVGGKLVISVMAGIQLSQLAAQLQTKRTVRALPNAAAEVRASYTPWIGAPDLEERDRIIVRDILDACGSTDEVASEGDLDYLSGLSGSGPAYPALLAAAMMEDAMARGITPRIARRAVDALLIGAGRLVEYRRESPASTLETFLDYRGITAAGIEAMRAAGFDQAVRSGLAAALARSVAMRGID